ncbi:MAG: UDP-N-acetylglucosamine--N-acetylmuramyl-(pentapeptide) pyrophosphoryl-undecaprenol N-acetylglucosamine transferase [Planctomycetes bacterium]|nr:UDP-N-acetylglucosamine--N-acetylmuramyl-(pentapeptide) pyrophosphoryl-undecaprenol N-acetylglucosamine transferase [Planctomycetota bacterium]
MSPATSSLERAPAAGPVPTARALRIALAGGGTGGHILPGRYLLEHAHSNARVADVVWFQTGRPVEERAMAGLAERLAPVALERVALPLEPDGGGAPSLSRLGVLTLPAARKARAALRRHDADVLVGLGGFTTLPAALAARSLGIPIVLVEINAAAGRATRWLAPFSTRVVHAWKATLEKGENAKHRWIGPPLAARFQRGAPSEFDARVAAYELGFEPAQPLLVVLGGSQGALGLNKFVSAHAPFFAANEIQVLHQVGPGRLAEAAQSAPAGYRAVEYVDDVHCALSAATLVLCRGGASTLAEVGALSRPALVVPYPHSPDHHQELNARELGAGVRIVQESALDSKVAREIVRLIGPAGAGERARMAAALGAALPRDGVARLWSEIEALAARAT